MLKRIKKGFISIFISVLCGFISGKAVYYIYQNENEDVFNNNKIYLIQNGTYSSYENMRAKTIGYDYVFYEDELGYNSIVAVTKNRKNIEKIIKLYNINADVIEYYLNNNEINNKINEYDKELEKENDKNKQKEIIKLMLEIYKNNKVTLSKSY